MGQKHYRVWWQKPKRYAEQEEERKVSFLELFYDLVYVGYHRPALPQAG